MDFTQKDFQELQNKEFLGYREVTTGVEELLESFNLNSDDYFIDVIIQDCFEYDGIIYSLVAEREELLASIDDNQR